MADWIINRPKATITCSKCKARLNAKLFMDLLEAWNFCPYCGADMRAEQTEPSDKCEQILDNIIAHKVEPIIKDGKVYLEQTEPRTEETEMERLERIDNELEDAWARIRELTDEPQTMCYPQVDGITPSVIVKTEPNCENCKHFGHNIKRCLLNKCKYEQTDCGWK